MKRETSSCVVIARVTPEHKVSKTNYKVKVEVDEANNIIKVAECQGCPASIGGCKHGIALLFWLHRRSEEPSVTETICYWRKSELSKVGTSKKFILLTDLTASANLDLSNKDDFLNKVISSSNNITDCMLLKMHKEVEMETLSLHHLYIAYVEETQSRNNVAEEFLKFCTNKMTVRDCNNAMKYTIEQSKSPLWYELKYGRITASKIYEASRCNTEDGTLVETVFGATKFPETLAMKRGLQLEEDVLRQCEKERNIKFNRCGLVLNPQYPVLGASPDAISKDFVVEIKCPSKEKTVSNYVKDNKVTIKYMSQIQMQMHFCKKNKGVFVVADPNFSQNNNIYVYEIDYDENFCIDLISKSMDFWKKHIFNKFK